jgi:hypothetical protein
MKRISRRTLLRQTSLMGTSVTIGSSLASDTKEAGAPLISLAKLKFKIVVTGGHPGDDGTAGLQVPFPAKLRVE